MGQDRVSFIGDVAVGVPARSPSAPDAAERLEELRTHLEQLTHIPEHRRELYSATSFGDRGVRSKFCRSLLPDKKFPATGRSPDPTEFVALRCLGLSNGWRSSRRTQQSWRWCCASSGTHADSCQRSHRPQRRGGPGCPSGPRTRSKTTRKSG